MTKYKISKIDTNLWDIQVNVLDPYSDYIQLFIFKNSDNIYTVTDDGYTDYNLACIGKISTITGKEISVTGTWQDKDNMIKYVVDTITYMYKNNALDILKEDEL